MASLIQYTASMNLLDIVTRLPPKIDPENWDKIPWNDPEISRRILLEHLSQNHDLASRRTGRITKHVNWIHTALLGGRTAQILDLGCGPGLYTAALTDLNHHCTGVDFSPASITFAKEQAQLRQHEIRYFQADIRTWDCVDRYDLILLIFGELNVFSPKEAITILRKCRDALVPGGMLLLEVHTLDGIQNLGLQESIWMAEHNGVFSDNPHLYLEESHWFEDTLTAVTTYYVIDARSGEIHRYRQCAQGYTEDQYDGILQETGFSDLMYYPSFGGATDDFGQDLMVIVAR